jgi:hypothetical protein
MRGKALASAPFELQKMSAFVVVLAAGRHRVSTGPVAQGGRSATGPGRVQSCVRPFSAVLMTAGPDEVRGSVPKQSFALDEVLTPWALTPWAAGHVDTALAAPQLSRSSNPDQRAAVHR